MTTQAHTYKQNEALQVPANSQSVEAAVQRIMKLADVMADLETDATLEADASEPRRPEYVAADNAHIAARFELEAAIRAALTSQQEVAAGVELTDERIFEIADSDECNPDDRGWGPKFSKLKFARACIAAGRVPVASLASREQGVEAVGAVPIGEGFFLPDGTWTGSASKTPGFLRMVEDDEANGCTIRPIYAAPPSSKTQDGLAGADSGGVHAPEIAQLMKFYNADTLEAVVLAQNRQIEGLQARLPRDNTPMFQRVREG